MGTETEEEESEETPPEEKPEGLSAEAVQKMIDDKVAEAVAKIKAPGAAKAPGATKRPSYRDEEESMAEKVEAAARELMAKEKAAGENHPDPKDEGKKPEPVPAQPRGRRVERFMGWH